MKAPFGWLGSWVGPKIPSVALPTGAVFVQVGGCKEIKQSGYFHNKQ